MRFSFLLITLLALPSFANVAVPKDQEICFSPDEPCDEKLAAFVGSAEKSVDIAIFDINLDQLVHQILLKSKKGKVRVIVDKRQSKSDKHSLVSTLVKAGASVRYGHQRGIMHDKFTIIDGKRLETGSFNYTNHAATANQENQIYLAGEDVLKRYQDRFEKMWKAAKPISEIEQRKPSAE